MTVKAFFFKSGSTWNYGTFESDGETPNVELTVHAGLYRSRWETVNNIVQLTIVNANNQGELAPFRAIPITEVASDLIGTPYANRAAFEAETVGFFASEPLATSDNQDLLLGKIDRVNPVGTAKYSAPEGFYFYACKDRIGGSKIASLEKSVSGEVEDDITDSYIGIAMYQGETHFFEQKIVSVTLTNATDQLQLYLAKL